MGLFGGSSSSVSTTTNQNQVYGTLDQSGTVTPFSVMGRDFGGASISQVSSPVNITYADHGSGLGSDVVAQLQQTARASTTSLTSSGVRGSLTDLLGLSTNQMIIAGVCIVAVFLLKGFFSK